MKRNGIFLFVTGILLLIFSACESVDQQRIPNLPVNISLADAGIWNSYGVSGYGMSRNFILNPSGISSPIGFSYSATSATGFGGVLLISGLDLIPLAYDLACPVERNPKILVAVDPETYFAVCKECGSVYDVTLAYGAPVAGPAASGKYKYELKAYHCIPSGYGGYYIQN